MRVELERTFEVLDTVAPTDLRREIERRMAEPAPPRLPGAAPPPWRRATAAAVALALFAAGALVVWRGFQGAHRRERPAGPVDPWTWAAEGWTELPLPPEVRDGAAIVWTGEVLVYWGGWPRGADVAQARADGFAFDPETRGWTALPPAPVPGGGAEAVWTGSEVLLWRVQVPGGGLASLAFDPETGAWRRLEDPILRPSWGGAWAWTGKELVVLGGGDRDDPTTVQGAALDPGTGLWRPIADAPMGVNLAKAVWTAAEVVVVGSEINRRNIAETPTAIALGYDPVVDTWRRLPDPPLSPQASEAVWFRDRLIAWDYGADSVQYLPAEDRWQGLGRLPLTHGECYVDGVAIETVVFAWNCGVPDAWYPDLGWVDVVGGPQDVQTAISDTAPFSEGRAIAAGTVVVVEQIDNIWIDHNLHIGSPEGPMHLWVWRPPTAPEPPPPPTREDAEYLVARFLTAWGWSETYLPPMATQDVIDRCRDGVGGCPPLGGGTYQDWKRGDVAEPTPGTFEVRLELRQRDGPTSPVVFVVGPGIAADGSRSDLIVLDVRPW